MSMLVSSYMFGLHLDKKFPVDVAWLSKGVVALVVGRRLADPSFFTRLDPKDVNGSHLAQRIGGADISAYAVARPVRPYWGTRGQAVVHTYSRWFWPGLSGHPRSKLFVMRLRRSRGKNNQPYGYDEDWEDGA